MSELKDARTRVVAVANGQLRIWFDGEYTITCNDDGTFYLDDVEMAITPLTEKQLNAPPLFGITPEKEYGSLVATEAGFHAKKLLIEKAKKALEELLGSKAVISVDPFSDISNIYSFSVKVVFPKRGE
jgi:hypothetical protein